MMKKTAGFVAFAIAISAMSCQHNPSQKGQTVSTDSTSVKETPLHISFDNGGLQKKIQKTSGKTDTIALMVSTPDSA